MPLKAIHPPIPILAFPEAALPIPLSMELLFPLLSEGHRGTPRINPSPVKQTANVPQETVSRRNSFLWNTYLWVKLEIMARKRWEAKGESTPELLQFREKRKWQTTFRRYVIEESPCPAYAAYFGLDIKNIRAWFERQFQKEMTWESFGKNWQFEHIVPLSLFNHSNDEHLRLCWNFINIRVQQIEPPVADHPMLAAATYLQQLLKTSDYPIAKALLKKVETEQQNFITQTIGQAEFLKDQESYLKELAEFHSFEYELLNHGKTITEIKAELALLRKEP